MDSTENFVKEFKEQQEKSKKSAQKSSNENSGHKLPGKQHSTNK